MAESPLPTNYVAWVSIVRGQWFPVGSAPTLDAAIGLMVAWRAPAGCVKDERQVLPAGKVPGSRRAREEAKGLRARIRREVRPAQNHSKS